MNLKLLFISVLCLMFFSISAQTKAEFETIRNSYDQERLSELKQELQASYSSKLKRALELAAENDWPVSYEVGDGGFALLVDVLNDSILLYYQTHNFQSGQTIQTVDVYSGGSLGLDISGQGMVLGIWDGGIVRATHQLMTNRPVQMDNPGGLSSHATHVAGTMMGRDGVQSNAPRGMAYSASELIAYDFGNDAPEFAGEAANGLLVSNHSYGLNAGSLPLYFFGRYDGNARDADLVMAAAPFYQLVCSAGNDRNSGINSSDNGFDLLTDLSVSKNSITVAAIAGFSNYVDTTTPTMSSFSSWGPTDDGRIKPDISAKGINVFSSRAASDTNYGNMSGTSMASPSVAGGAILLQQLHNTLRGSFMRASTLRGLILHTANEAGNSPGPDARFGWGVMSVKNAAEALINNDFRSIVEEHTLNDAGTFTKTITALGNEPLKVSITWTDPAGQVGSTVVDDTTPALVNDLDISLTEVGGNQTIHLPWRLNPIIPSAPATKGINNVDNIELVEINVPAGDYIITVNHKGVLQGGSQVFSLIATGIDAGPIHMYSLEPSIQVCEDAADISFEFVQDPTHTGSTSFTAVNLPAGVSASFSPANISSDGNVTATLTGFSSLAPGIYPITFRGTTGNFDRDLVVNVEVTSFGPVSGVSIVSPSNALAGVPISPTFSWTADPDAESYTLEIATSPSFLEITIIHVEEGITSTSFNYGPLNENTTYYWRVRAENVCSVSAFDGGSFTTDTLTCDVPLSAQDLPQTITTVPNTVTSQILVPITDDSIVSKVEVEVILNHTWVSDLTISLTSPAGTVVTLVQGQCGDGNNMNVIFDDFGLDLSCNTTIPAISGVIKPLDRLNDFFGENTAGTWTLTVTDNFNQDGGSLTGFNLVFCSGNTLSNDEFISENNFSMYPNPANGFVNLKSGVALEDTQINIYDLTGRRLINIPVVDGSFEVGIDVQNLNTGMYLVEIQTAGKRFTKRLIVE
ncbi:MAG: S8 family serine peptidase [Flavobacteriaceae bacterium]|nr:S8 family serine peptidase [Flavobacteriaceae bacterium]